MFNNELKIDIEELKKEFNFKSRCFYLGFYPEKTTAERIEELETKVDLLMDYLKVEEKTITEKTILEKKK